ncbi:Transcription termination factor Rho [Saccharothrix espanaensis DSM 44229]|uniref:Transcription termination factor Rho n=2 Tax=Saccharothrix espanaensis TaxID=103731 RepID=K0K105_SACES|nr:Transcription termination factor Rho [Saccharothrix espanaensis DSM 44229]
MTATLQRGDKTTTTTHTPVTGVLDVVGANAFIRTSGYLPGPNDVFVPPSTATRFGLRRGDLVAGSTGPGTGRHQRPQLVQVDRVNGQEAGKARHRPEFADLVPVHPTERLRLETRPDELTTRVVDLLMPVGKGQRALIVAPPKAGKTSVLCSIAQGISRNNPECHLIVVLVGERPEEVTDLRRTVPGEVVASTFDRSPADHIALAELAVERAKRLVEQGRDVVVLLDSLTRLGRAYNLAAPASGRTLSGGIDSSALLPPKRFLGAARNIEGGGSLTIFATALVETGSTGDTLIFEEYKATGNAELKLDRKVAAKRVFPAVDVEQSGTRRDDLLLSPEELAVTQTLRRALDGRDVDMLLEGLRKTRTNYEFLSQLSRPAAA